MRTFGVAHTRVPRSRSRFCESTRVISLAWKRCNPSFPFRPTKTRRVLMKARQRFCSEVVLWKRFKHPNLLQLVGVKKSPSAMMMISKWMEHGTIIDFVIACPGTNRLKLVSVLPRLGTNVHQRRFCSWQMLLVGWSTSMPGRLCTQT